MPARRLLAAAATRPWLVGPALRLLRLVPGRRARARIYRSVSWQLAKRANAVLDVRVSGGSTMRVSTIDGVGRALAVSGTWEPNVTSAFCAALAPGDVCIDVGAHIGYYTLLASKLVGGDGHVYAFEPSTANARGLRENLVRNGANNVTTYEAAVGTSPGRAILYEGPGTNTGRATLSAALARRVATDAQGVEVEVRSVADAVPEAVWPRVRVAKVDVEGSEVEVLRALEPIFAAGEPLSVFLEFNAKWIDDPSPAEYVEALCRRHRFTLWRLRTGYGLEDLFPLRLTPAEQIDSVPAEPADLLLTRGREPA